MPDDKQSKTDLRADFRGVRIARASVERFPNLKYQIEHLPSSDKLHFRGFLIEGRSLWGRWLQTPEWYDEPEINSRVNLFEMWTDTIVCHTKPLEDEFVDVPDRFDIYRLLRCWPEDFGFAGKTMAAKISRTSSTNPTVLSLREWELAHPYRMSRLKKLYEKTRPAFEYEHRYAASALKGIGLCWPNRACVLKKTWMKHLEDIGLEVEERPVPRQKKRVAGEGSLWGASDNGSKLNPNLGAPKFAVNPMRHTADQIEAKLKYADVMRKSGQPLEEVLRVLGISQDTYYRWGGSVDTTITPMKKRIEELEAEVVYLKNLVTKIQNRQN